MDATTNHPPVVRKYDLRPEPGLAELFPEYDEPIEPGEGDMEMEMAAVDPFLGREEREEGMRGGGGVDLIGEGKRVVGGEKKHHCLIDGHIFARWRDAGDEGMVGGKTRNMIEEKKVSCERCRGRIGRGEVWGCEVEVCGIKACWECKKSWDQERREKALGSWRSAR